LKYYRGDIQGVEPIAISMPLSPFRIEIYADETDQHDVWAPFRAPTLHGAIKVPLVCASDAGGVNDKAPI
jgi:hypothetical protein